MTPGLLCPAPQGLSLATEEPGIGVRACVMCQELDRALPSSSQQICEEGGGKGWTQPFSFLPETLT